jgi:arabinogalactan oligomer/maltooligosaccharide transport system permease protein
LKQVDAICQPFSTIWLRVPKIKVPASEARGTPEEIAQWRKQAIRQWRDSVLQSWQTTSLATLRLTQPKAKQEAQKLLKEIALQQRERLQQGSLFWQQVLNSVLVALATTILGLFLACTAAYAFSRFRFPGRRMGLMSFLVSQMFPGTLMMIPLYILISRLGLLNSLLGLTLVYSTTSIPFCVWMLKGYFDTIPKELEEAALIDGASRTLIFWKIMLPLARPAIAVTALFSFMTAWNEFILAVTFMNDKTSFTLPVMLQQYVGSHNTEWGHFAAGAVLVSLPIVLLFFLLQRNLVSGLTAGGVKG